MFRWRTLMTDIFMSIRQMAAVCLELHEDTGSVCNPLQQHPNQILLYSLVMDGNFQ